MINPLSIEVQCDSNLGVIDEIIHSGKLSIFSNDELKFLLSSWSGILYRVRLQEQELLNMRSRTIEMVRNNVNLRLGLGDSLADFGIKRTKFKQSQLHLLQYVQYEGHMTGLATMSLNLNNDY